MVYQRFTKLGVPFVQLFLPRTPTTTYGLRCTGMREESSIVLFGKVVMALFGRCCVTKLMFCYKEETGPR